MSTGFGVIPASEKFAQGEVAKKKGSRRSFTGGYEIVVRGVLRYTNALLSFFLLLSFVCNLWLVYAWRANVRELSGDVRKQWVVFSVDSQGRTSAREAAEFQTGPTPLQIDGRAWEIASLVATAGSTDVEQKYRDAGGIMTARFRAEFEDTLGSEKEEIKRLQIYHELEDGDVRQATPDDFRSQPVQPELTRYDRIVTGRLSTFHIASRERVLTRHVAFHVRLVPEPEPTRENPSGLLVDRLVPVKLPAKTEEVSAHADGK